MLPLKLCGSTTSAYDPGIWQRPRHCSALLKTYKPSEAQGVTVGVVVDFPQRQQKQSDQHAQNGPRCVMCRCRCGAAGDTRRSWRWRSVQLERGLQTVDSARLSYLKTTTGSKASNPKTSMTQSPQSRRSSSARTQTEEIVKIYEPTHVLLDARILAHARAEYRTSRQSPSPLLSSKAQKAISFPYGGTPAILSAARHVLNDWNYQKITVLLRVARAAHRAYTLDDPQYWRANCTRRRDDRPSTDCEGTRRAIRTGRHVRGEADAEASPIRN